MTAKVTGKRLVVTLENGRELLLIQVDVSCPDCGDWSIQLAGHHVGTLLDILQGAQRDHPALCGDVGQKGETLTIRGRVDREQGRYN